MSSPDFEKICEKKILIFLSHQVQDLFNVEMNIFLNYNHMWKIYTSLYVEFKVNKIYFKDTFIFTLVNVMRYTCDEIHRKKYIDS